MKSHVSDLVEVAICIYKDAMAKSTANSPDLRDINKLISRVEHEGISFLTITLPDFGKDFERALSHSLIDSTLFVGFAKRGKCPAFLQGLFSLVFNVDTGRILDEPEVAAIEAIRQIAYTFKKLGLPCNPDRVHKAFIKYKEDELDLSGPLSPVDIMYFHDISAILWNGTLGSSIDPLDRFPKHGPGATAEGISGNSKYTFRRWTKRLELYFPSLDYAFTNGMAYQTREFKDLSFDDENCELPVKVITVPKTLKSPRIIAIEPVCMQYTQQAISSELVTTLENSYYTRGHVNFTDQSINRSLALESSKTCQMATLDLSSASDRVPLSLAISMFRSNPYLYGAILACRSKTAKLPTGEVINLKKFASMGSALCFPVESMYFYTICIGALLRSRTLPVTSQNIFMVSRDVYIYGDDIIIPADEAEIVIANLQKYYCKVGSDKSFWTGKFRESCGMDAYDGEDVTPVYVRHLPPNDKRSTSALLSWISTSNLFYKKGYWKTSAFLVEKCERLLGKLPIVADTSAALGKRSFQRVVSYERWGRRYHRPEVWSWVAAPVYRIDKLDGMPALLKCLLRLESQPTTGETIDSKHLQRTARYGAVRLKRRWTAPY